MQEENSLDKQNVCRVCGADLGESVIEARGNDLICSSCGLHYGYEDIAGNSVEWRENIYKTWRERWLRNEKRPISSKEEVIEIIQSSRPKQGC